MEHQQVIPVTEVDTYKFILSMLLPMAILMIVSRTIPQNTLANQYTGKQRLLMLTLIGSTFWAIFYGIRYLILISTLG
jgi:hypothetical protein